MAALPKIGVAGMTHLGINTAAAIAERGFFVVGYHDDPSLVEQLAKINLPINEPNLDSYIYRNIERIKFSSDLNSLVDCDVIYIAIDVPTDDDGRSNLLPINNLIESVAHIIGDDTTVVVLCQVPPTFCRSITCIPHSQLIYQVETLIFGKAIERAMYPERFIIGLADTNQSIPSNLLALLKVFDCPILPMRYESAELAKISINFCLVSSVTVANMLAEISEKIGADWLEIVPSLRLDKRIGPNAYLTPGLGISGGNLERDLRTILNIAERNSSEVSTVEAWIKNSNYRKNWLWQCLRENVFTDLQTPNISILGLAYKENTNSTKNSPALQLLTRLTDMVVKIHDPVVPNSTVPWAIPTKNVRECVSGSDVLIIATPWDDYKNITITELCSLMKGRIIIDPYRILDGKAATSAGFKYHTLGKPSSL